MVSKTLTTTIGAAAETVDIVLSITKNSIRNNDLIGQGVAVIFAQNDVMAIGVLDYCNENGISVGSDLALIGFDTGRVVSVQKTSVLFVWI